MEEKLQKFLASLTWLNVGDDRLQAEFAAHAGWSLAVTFFGHVLAGTVGLYVTGGLWIAYSLYKECYEDGHLINLIKGQPDDTKDFVTDLISRILPAALAITITALV